jgi:hypothetical protein
VLNRPAIGVGVRPSGRDRRREAFDDMIRVAHRAGASMRQIAEVSGLDRKTVSAIVASRSAT